MGFMLFTVQYRCIYREHWYDDSDFTQPAQAIGHAQMLHFVSGRTTRVTDGFSVIWQLA